MDVINDEQCGFRRKGRIVGGKTAAPGAWPWQVRLGYWRKPFFGGTLINKQWVLTSSHAFGHERNNIPPKFVRVVLGDLDRNVTEGKAFLTNLFCISTNRRRFWTLRCMSTPEKSTCNHACLRYL